MRSWYAMGVLILLSLSGVSCAYLHKETAAPPTLERQVPARAPETTLRAVSFNILYAGNKKFPWADRRDSVVAALRDMDPDVFGLQEAEYGQLLYLMDRLPEYACIARCRDDGHTAGEAMGLFYRTNRFILKTAETFWLSDTPEIAGSNTWGGACVRCATVAILIDRTDGRTVGVCNTHFDHVNAEARAKSGQLVRRRLPEYGKDIAWILTGDFNTTAGSAPYVALTDPKINALRLTDTFAATNPNAPADASSFHGYDGTLGKRRIDFIFCSQEFEPLAAGINQFKYLGRYPTDHFPVWADVKRVK